MQEIASKAKVLRRAADLKLPIITRYVCEGPAKWSLAYGSGWDAAICRSPSFWAV